jgi:glycosyltransferase involved in cell wall biosynthesis
MSPIVSVVIPCFNYGRFLRDAVASVRSQTFAEHEIIVVDDGSTDDTEDVARELGAAIRYLCQSNQGPAAARNTGIAAARGRYIGFLDADDMWHPEKLARQVPILDARPEVVLVYADSTYFDSATGCEVGRHRDRFAHYEGRVLGRLVEAGNFIPSPTPLVRRAILEDVGGFDASLRGMPTEDWDLWVRVAARGEVAYIDESLARYRLHGAQASRNVDALRDGQLRVLNKVPPADIAAAGVDMRRARRNVWVDCGLCHLTLGNYGETRRNLWRAALTDPRMLADPRLTARLLLSLGGGAVFGLARTLRRMAVPVQVLSSAVK